MRPRSAPGAVHNAHSPRPFEVTVPIPHGGAGHRLQEIPSKSSASAGKGNQSPEVP